MFPLLRTTASVPTPKAPQADNRCRLACVQTLKRVVKSGILIIDSAGEVLKNYRAYWQHRGQPGVGDAFYKHVFDHQSNPKKVRRILIAKNAKGEFKDFPTDPTLATFDPSDRVYVAPAVAAPEKPLILNAVDSDYFEHRTALEGVGVHVREICPQCIRTRRLTGGQSRCPEGSENSSND